MLICAPDGGIVNDPILLKLAEDRFWLSLADSDALLYAVGVQAFAGMDVTIREPDVSPLQVQGPRSKDVIRKLFGDDVMNLKYYWCTEAELDGIPVVVSRTGWTGEVGYEIYLRDASRGTDLWDAVMDAGQEFDIRAIAPSDQRRMEAGIFNYGNDMDITNNPFEVTGLERLVELDNDNVVVSRDALQRVGRRGCVEEAGRRADRRTTAADVARGLLARDEGRREVGQAHVRVVLAATRLQHGIRLGADRARARTAPRCRSSRRWTR